MIQKNSYLIPSDKCGVWWVSVFHVYKGSFKKIAYIGDFVKVIYLTKNRIKMSVAREIEEETISLYKLLSPDELDDLFIQFESVDDEEN